MSEGKWLFLAGLGAGAALALRMSEKQISSVKGFAAKIANSESVTDARRVATEKMDDVLRTQGAKLIDKLAESLKTQLNAGGSAAWAGFANAGNARNTPPEASTTSTDKNGVTRDKDGHVIIDGKIVA